MVSVKDRLAHNWNKRAKFSYMFHAKSSYKSGVIITAKHLYVSIFNAGMQVYSTGNCTSAAHTVTNIVWPISVNSQIILTIY